MRRIVTLGLLTITAVATATTAMPREASACGGTFCDAGAPSPMPVDQTGENILFVAREGMVEAHVQIQYSGDPEQFAWIVPVPGNPEVEVGSQQLMSNLLSATVPTFTVNNTFTNCGGGRGGPALGCSADDAAGRGDALGTAGSSGGDGGEDDGTPDVVQRGSVGAFEFAVLDGGDVEGVMTWLGDNGFLQDEIAAPILAEYLAEGMMFVAFRLEPGAGIDEIHPIVMRYAGSEPMVPIRLTRIAAADDMPVRVFVLGNQRFSPQNYASVQINPFALDWFNPADDYNELVSRAVDESPDGHGFVTEYAGPSMAVDSDTLIDDRWDTSALFDIAAVDAVDALTEQGLMQCGSGSCVFFNPLVEPLLETYLPAPPQTPPEAFWACLTCYEGLIDTDAWRPSEFAADLEERVFGPAEHARDLLWSNPYLTRLLTTLSPREMTLDPSFRATGGDNVDSQYTAQRIIDCEGTDKIIIDDADLYLDDLGNMPFLQDMPFALIADAPDGETLVDNTDAIDSARRQWNAEAGSDGGCNCRSSRRHGWGFLFMAGMLGFAWRGRRPRNRRVANRSRRRAR